MFIKPSKFEKIIKTDYKRERLHVGNDGINFLAAGAGWSLAMVEDLMPKELKAVVIKYVGRMPEKYEYFLALAAGDQAEVAEAFVIGKENTKELTYAEATHLAYVDGSMLYNIFQSANDKYDFFINASLVDLIDETMIDLSDGETGISGPFLDRSGRQIIVENDRMQLRLFMRSLNNEYEEELLNYLKETDLNAFGENNEEA